MWIRIAVSGRRKPASTRSDQRDESRASRSTTTPAGRPIGWPATYRGRPVRRPAAQVQQPASGLAPPSGGPRALGAASTIRRGPSGRTRSRRWGRVVHVHIGLLHFPRPAASNTARAGAGRHQACGAEIDGAPGDTVRHSPTGPSHARAGVGGRPPSAEPPTRKRIIGLAQPGLTHGVGLTWMRNSGVGSWVLRSPSRSCSMVPVPPLGLAMPCAVAGG